MSLSPTTPTWAARTAWTCGLGPRDRVERAERLIQEQQLLARKQRAQERHSLPHPGRQLRRAQPFRAGEPEPGEQGCSQAPRPNPQQAPVLER
jgi:hypothetical protein